MSVKAFMYNMWLWYCVYLHMFCVAVILNMAPLKLPVRLWWPQFGTKATWMNICSGGRMKHHLRLWRPFCIDRLFALVARMRVNMLDAWLSITLCCDGHFETVMWPCYVRCQGRPFCFRILWWPMFTLILKHFWMVFRIPLLLVNRNGLVQSYMK